MHWLDDGIVLGVRKHGEANAILELMTRSHGRPLGLVTYTVEGLNLRAGSLLTSSHAVYAVTHLAALARLLPERDPHESVYDSLDTILGTLDDPALAGAQVVHFEMQMLVELGFGLDLMSCAATGRTQDLIYVSPKSGRAVSREAGEEWRHRLLPLPAFLTEDNHGAPSATEIAEGFRLTGFFLGRDVLEPRNLLFADARAHFIAAIGRALPNAA
jgi:DNA repair protein RecO (recombination protein O)